MGDDAPTSGNSAAVRPYLWMLSGCLVFAIMSILTHELRFVLPWPAIAFTRSVLPCLFIGAFAIVTGTRLVFFRPRILWMRSIAGSISLVCAFYAMTHMPVSDVLTITNTFPIWVALLSWPLLRERPGIGVWIATGCGVVGVVLVQQPHIREGNFACVAALVSSFATAIAMIGLHRLKEVDPPAIVVHFSAVSCLFSGAALFCFQPPEAVDWNLGALSLVMLLGIGVTASIGQLCLTKAFTAGPAARVSVVGLTQIVFAAVLEVIFLHYQIDSTKLVGMGMVIAPTAWLMAVRA
jgi:drug/metabolite transporter (DMT)-like permease